VRGTQQEDVQDDVMVERDIDLRETRFTIAAGDCRIVWTVFGTEINRGLIRHRAVCGLPLSDQAPLIGMLLRKVMSSGAAAADFQTLDWGRLYPDGISDETMAIRLSLAASRSPEWDAGSGAPRKGDINGWVRRLANASSIFKELHPLFLEAGLEIQLSAVEKVLVLQARQLPFHEKLRLHGVQAEDKVPFDCQVWFSVRPVGGRQQ